MTLADVRKEAAHDRHPDSHRNDPDPSRWRRRREGKMSVELIQLNLMHGSEPDPVGWQTALYKAVSLVAPFLDGVPIEHRVSRLNELRKSILSFSPFREEPVDFVEWLPADSVQANDYNPNVVAPPEMELLRISVMADGYTQPIVTHEEITGLREVVDGFHRNRVGKECEDVRARVHGFLPTVVIQSSRTDKADRMAATIRHNRARGKHRIEGMSEIVLALKRRNWTDKKISNELGMDPDEVLRLSQISGMAEAFKDRDFNLAWEAEIAAEEDDDLREVDGT